MLGSFSVPFQLVITEMHINQLLCTHGLLADALSIRFDPDLQSNPAILSAAACTDFECLCVSRMFAIPNGWRKKKLVWIKQFLLAREIVLAVERLLVMPIPHLNCFASNKITWLYQSACAKD